MLVRASEGAAGSSGCGQETGGCNRGSEEDSEGTGSSSEEAQVSLSGSTLSARGMPPEGQLSTCVSVTPKLRRGT